MQGYIRRVDQVLCEGVGDDQLGYSIDDGDGFSDSDSDDSLDGDIRFD